MNAVQMIVVWGAVAFGAMLIAAVLAGVKNRDWSTWAAWAFVFPPTVLILLLTPRKMGARPRRPTLDELDSMGH